MQRATRVVVGPEQQHALDRARPTGGTWSAAHEITLPRASVVDRLALRQRRWRRASANTAHAHARALATGLLTCKRVPYRLRLALACLALTSCIADRTVYEPVVDQDRVTVFDIPQDAQHPLDVLFVVDRSPAMRAHAAHVAGELTALVEVMAARGDPDWHLGVITSDLGDAEGRPGCDARGDGGALRHDGLVGAPFVIEWRHLDGRHTHNYEGSLASAFARLAAVGHDGCARSQPLAAITHALAEPRNAGFRRAGATLLVVIVGAVDDASPAPVARYATFLRGLGDPRALHVIAIHDDPAPRLAELVAAFPDRGQQQSIRTRGLAHHLWTPFGGGGWGAPCIEGELWDHDLAAGGVQATCAVSDVIVRDDQRLLEQPLPTCDALATIRPCWRLVDDPQGCPAPWTSGYRVEVERHDYPPPGTHLIGNCVTAVSIK